jgi:PAS domain S-box-containing protein
MPQEAAGRPQAAPAQPSALSSADILHSLPVGILLIDLDGRVIQANHQVAALLALPVTKLPGLNVAEFWPRGAGEILAIARSGRQAAGLVLPELDNCFVQTNPLSGGRPGLAITIFDQRLWRPYLRSGPALDPLTPYYKKIFESSSDGISIADSQGRLILVNAASAAHVGVKPEDIQGRHVSYLVEQNLTDGTVSMEVIRTRKPATRLIKHLKSNKHLLLTGTPIFSPDGEVHLVVINERDLTGLLELETSLKQQTEILARFKDELAALQLAELAGDEMLALSPAMNRTLDTALKLARHRVPQILISGESGTGKGHLAKFIHAQSPLAAEPFIHINCAALPESLLEAELFGYEKGAFTGAAPEGRAGLFEAAGRGTAFLDEIGEMPPALQAKLLTFLDNHEFRRLGGRQTITAACAVIAATNQDLEHLAARKKFRPDLYYRLSLFRLHIPPLRERPEDLLELARREVKKLGARYGLTRELDPQALEALRRHSFPGNVRELLSCLHQAVLLSDGPALGPFLRQALAGRGRPLPAPAGEAALPAPAAGGKAGAPAERLGDRLEETERAGLLAALAQCRTTREMAARLGISQAGVSRKLRKYGLAPPGARPGRRKR